MKNEIRVTSFAALAAEFERAENQRCIAEAAKLRRSRGIRKTNAKRAAAKRAAQRSAEFDFVNNPA